MKVVFAFAASALMVWLAFGAEQTTPAKKPTTPSRKPAAKTGASTAKKRPATPAKKSATNSKKAPAKRTTWRNRQTAPSPERYREIQDALVAKGYLNSADANGTWNQSSTDALKRFQTEQNIEASGKINSLSLIALGLGPKHDAVATQPKPPQ